MNAYQRAAMQIWMWQCQLAHAFHIARLHRRQGVWGNLKTVCCVQPGQHPILTSYNQDRLRNHRVS